MATPPQKKFPERMRPSKSADKFREDDLKRIRAMTPLQRIRLALKIGRRDAFLRRQFAGARSTGLEP